jgi:Ankyrin repeats (3 copies)
VLRHQKLTLKTFNCFLKQQSIAVMSDSSDEEGGGRGYPLHDAVEAGDLMAIRAMLQAPSARSSAAAAHTGDASAEGPENGHSMFEDADEDDDEYDPFSARIDIDERDHEGCTPLHVALLYRQLGALLLLLEHKAAVARNLEGSTPAHIALSVGAVPRHAPFALEALKLLLQAGADLTAKDDRGQTLVHLAASLALDACLALLLHSGQCDSPAV